MSKRIEAQIRVGVKRNEKNVWVWVRLRHRGRGRGGDRKRDGGRTEGIGSEER